MCLQGKFTITTGECEPVLVNKGETVLIPACFKNLTLYPDDITQILEIYVEEWVNLHKVYKAKLPYKLYGPPYRLQELSYRFSNANQFFQ